MIGPNAAGKSSLFKRIAGLAQGPGRVELSPDAQGKRAVCYMPQDTGSGAVLTVYESVILAVQQGAGWAAADAELGRIDALLATLRIEDIAFRNLGELSGGRRQLVALARGPRVLLMDEPTSALDLSRQVEVLSLVSRLARERGMAVMVALHDLDHALRFCRDAIVIAEGRMMAAGPAAEVITPAFLRQVYKVGARVEPCSRGRLHVIIDQQAG